MPAVQGTPITSQSRTHTLHQRANQCASQHSHIAGKPRQATLHSQRRGTSSRARYLQQLDKGEEPPQVIARPHRGDVPLILLFLPRGDTARHAQPHGGVKLDDVRRSEVVRIRSWAIEHLDCCIRRHSHLHPRPWCTFLKQIKGISHRHSHRTTSQRRRDPHAQCRNVAASDTIPLFGTIPLRNEHLELLKCRIFPSLQGCGAFQTILIVNHCHTADCATQSAHQTAILSQTHRPSRHPSAKPQALSHAPLHAPSCPSHPTNRKPPHRQHTPPHPLKAPSFAKTLHQNNPTESHPVSVPESSQSIMPIAGKFANKSLRKRREYAVMWLFWT